MEDTLLYKTEGFRFFSYLMKKIVLLGSFRKHYTEICECLSFFKKHDILVLSPLGSMIRDQKDGFVFFQTDDSTLEPYQIEQQVLEKIKQADLVFVCNVDGYLGKTTSFEIGFCKAHGIPLCFLEKPKDLFYFLKNEKIYSKEMVVKILKK